MPDQRKYIIQAFLIFAIVFVGIYFVTGFISIKSNPGYCGTVEDNKIINLDTSRKYVDGKILFQSKCAACHTVQIDIAGPALAGVTERGPWTDRKNIYDFLKNPMKFRISDKYMQDLRKKYPFAHPAFLMENEDVDAILRYINL
jgi:Cytochrome c